MKVSNIRAPWLVFGFALTLALTSCSGSDDDDKLMIIHHYLKDHVKTLDPAAEYDTVGAEVVPSIYETLYQYDYLADGYKVVPLLASDMPKLSKDRLTVTIPIQHGILYHDDPCFKNTHGKGREMVARDFINGIKRLALPSLNSPGYWIFDGKMAGFSGFHEALNKASKKDLPGVFAQDIEGIKAVDDYTLQLKFIKPYPQLMYILAMTFTSPVPQEAVDAYGDEKGNLTDHPVGTGPYFLKRWDRGRRLVLDRNPTHHVEYYPTDGSIELRQKGMFADAGKLLPFADRVLIDIIVETQPRWLNFMKGIKDILEIPKDNFSQAITDQRNVSPELAARGIRLSIDISTSFYYISMNVQDKLLSNKSLRQAISSALDRDKWIELFNNGAGVRQTSALPPGISDRPKNSKIKYDFDLAKAKELMTKAGFPGGKGLPPLNFDLRGADTLNRQIGDFMQRQLSVIGINLNVIPNTFPAYLEKMKNNLLQISYGGWTLDYPDAENSFQILFGENKSPGPNDSNFDNPEMNKLYLQMAIMESGPKRAAIIERMDEILKEECPWALGFNYADYRLSQPWLMNYRAAEIIQNRFKYYRVDKEMRKRYLEANSRH